MRGDESRGEVPTSSNEGWNAITCDFTNDRYFNLGFRLVRSAN